MRENELFVRIVELDPELLLPYLLARRGRSQQAILDLVAEQLRFGQEVGQVRDGDPDVLARALLLTTHGFALSSHTMVDELASRGRAGRRAVADPRASDPAMSRPISRIVRVPPASPTRSTWSSPGSA